MQYILARIYGLLNREVSIYRTLIREMLVEREALALRDLSALKKCLENQRRLVDEIYDVRKDCAEEQVHLCALAKVPISSQTPTRTEIARAVGEDHARKLRHIEDQVIVLVKKAQAVNLENRKSLEIGYSFITSYIDSLSEIRARAFGYGDSAEPDTHQRHLIINEQS